MGEATTIDGQVISFKYDSLEELDGAIRKVPSTNIAEFTDGVNEALEQKGVDATFVKGYDEFGKQTLQLENTESVDLEKLKAEIQEKFPDSGDIRVENVLTDEGKEQSVTIGTTGAKDIAETAQENDLLKDGAFKAGEALGGAVGAASAAASDMLDDFWQPDNPIADERGQQELQQKEQEALLDKEQQKAADKQAAEGKTAQTPEGEIEVIMEGRTEAINDLTSDFKEFSDKTADGLDAKEMDEMRASLDTNGDGTYDKADLNLKSNQQYSGEGVDTNELNAQYHTMRIAVEADADKAGGLTKAEVDTYLDKEYGNNDGKFEENDIAQAMKDNPALAAAIGNIGQIVKDAGVEVSGNDNPIAEPQAPGQTPAVEQAADASISR